MVYNQYIKFKDPKLKTKLKSLRKQIRSDIKQEKIKYVSSKINVELKKK